MRDKNTAEESSRELVEAYVRALERGGIGGPKEPVERARWIAGVYASTLENVGKAHEEWASSGVQKVDADRATRLACDWFSQTAAGSEFLPAEYAGPWLAKLYAAVLGSVIPVHVEWGGGDPGDFGVIRLATDLIRRHANSIAAQAKGQPLAAGVWIGTFYAGLCGRMRSAVAEVGATRETAWTTFCLTAAVSPLPREGEDMDAAVEGARIGELFHAIMVATHAPRR